MALDEPMDPERSASIGPSKPRLLQVLGPGLITGASDDDPSGIATYSQAGAQFGFALCWTLLLTYPLMVAVQEISARVGRATGRGIAGNAARLFPAPIVFTLILLLFAANAINIGADLGAMADALAILAGGSRHLFVLLFGAVCILMQVFLKYTRYVSVLKWLTLALFAYVATVLAVEVPWKEAAAGLLIPTLSSDAHYWEMVVAIFGTTISPYLFFWQASQEVEDIREMPRREPLVRRPDQAADAYSRIRLDTAVGMAFSNLVALCIIITVGATLYQAGIHNIESSTQAAEALKPIAGSFAFALFTIGIVGTGLLSIPVLAGSAAYALGETMHWRVGLSKAPTEAKAFYATVAIATAIGVAFSLLDVNPIKALYWSAIINGVVAVPVLIALMLMTGERGTMRTFAVGGPLRVLGWITVGAMAAAVAGMALTALFE
jgi:NRAMP (natural resistance-associated macrophage protein)-like metal ion transporter